MNNPDAMTGTDAIMIGAASAITDDDITSISIQFNKKQDKQAVKWYG